MLSVESTGKNIEKAIENALLELKAPREDVDIKILSEGGLFKKAKVQVSISADAIEKYQKKSQRRIIADEVEPEEEPKAKVQKVEKTKKVEKPAKKEDKKPEEKTEPVKEKAEKKEKKEKVLDPIEFLTGYFKVLGKDVTVDVTEEGDYRTYSVKGEDLGEAIGHRGEAYYALTTIFQAVTGKQEKRYLLDIDSYREKREESLQATAKRIADKVAKSGRYYKLEPMKPAERRIIHTALQDDDRVTTLSKGTEPKRFVIVFPKEYKDK